jgi:hypothetical protein
MGYCAKVLFVPVILEVRPDEPAAALEIMLNGAMISLIGLTPSQ